MVQSAWRSSRVFRRFNEPTTTVFRKRNAPASLALHLELAACKTLASPSSSAWGCPLTLGPRCGRGRIARARPSQKAASTVARAATDLRSVPLVGALRRHNDRRRGSDVGERHRAQRRARHAPGPKGNDRNHSSPRARATRHISTWVLHKRGPATRSTPCRAWPGPPPSSGRSRSNTRGG